MLQAPWLFSDEAVHFFAKSGLPEAKRVYVNQSNSIYQNSRGVDAWWLLAIRSPRRLRVYFRIILRKWIITWLLGIDLMSALQRDLERMSRFSRWLSEIFPHLNGLLLVCNVDVRYRNLKPRNAHQ